MSRLGTYLRDGRISVLPVNHPDVGLSYCPEVTLVNPVDRHLSPYLFQFGIIGTTYLLAWGRGIEDALEEAAGWLADHAPGHLTEPDYAAAARELGLEGVDPDCDGTMWAPVAEAAEADLTYTESGWLVSYEWWVDDADQAQATAAALVAEYQAGNLDCYFDRFGILEAWNLWLQHNWAGQDSPEYKRHSRMIELTRFRPGYSAQRLETLDEPAAGIYARLLVTSLGGDP